MYKNYNMNQISLPLELEYIIPNHDISYLINDFVESMPSSYFERFTILDGRPMYNPRMMLKIIICAYSQGVFSGRKIEALLHDSLRMMWLAQGETPSYRTINRFRVKPETAKLLQACFTHFRYQLLKEKLIDGETIYIDGTKIEANAQKYTFVWRKAIDTNEKKMMDKITREYQELMIQDIVPAINIDEHIQMQDIEVMQKIVENKVEDYTEEIEGSTDMPLRKQLRSERKLYKQLLKQTNDVLQRKATYEHHRKILGTRNSYSKTDHDATFMRMKEDHMMNGQLKAGYNIQIATQNQYVLDYGIYPNPTDFKTLRPFIESLQKSFSLPVPTNVVADAGYGSEENYEYIMDTLGSTPLITYTMYMKEQKKKYKTNIFNSNNWKYHEKDDYYICPQGEVLEYRGYAQRYEKQFRKYQAQNCRNCPLKSQCTKAKNPAWNKVIQKNMNWEYFKAHVHELLSDEKTGTIYKQRKIDVEPVFGYLKAILGFTRMSVRGNQAVNNEIGFAMMAVNMRKQAKQRV